MPPRNIAIKFAVLWFLKGCVQFPIAGLNANALYDCVLHIIQSHFPGECVCFFIDSKNYSRMFDELIEEVGEQKSVYVVSPITDGEELNEAAILTKTKPLKPYPCNFVIDLPHVGSDMAKLFLRGGYHRGDYSLNLNKSRYLVIAEEQHDHYQATAVLKEMFRYGFLDLDLVNPGESHIEISTLFPFGRNFKDCPERTQPSMETIAIWKNGRLEEKTELYPNKLPSDVFAGCSWNISCSFFVPYLIVDTGGKYTGPLTGYDGGPLSLLMNRLNLTPEWTVDIVNFWITDYKNGTVLGAVPNLILGRGSQMCCGGLYQETWGAGNADPTHFHTWATISWFLAAPDKVPKWIMVFEALEKPVWLIVITAGIIIPIIYWIFCILTKRPHSLADVYLLLTAALFSNSTGSAPINNTLRVIFISWLIYTLHIDQFYLASLTRLITNADYEPMMKTVDELLDTKLPTAVFPYTARTLLDASDPKILKLMENYVTITKVLNKDLERMSLYKNFSIADNQVFFKYTVAEMNNVSVYQTPINYRERTMGALMWRHHYLFKRINWLLLRMYDAGFPEYFLKQTVPNRFWTNPEDNIARPFNLSDLSGPFYILLIGLLLSFVTFLGELLYFNRYIESSELVKPRGIYSDNAA